MWIPGHGLPTNESSFFRLLLSPSRALSVLVTPSPPPNPDNIMGRCDQTTIFPETQALQMPPPSDSGARPTPKEDEHQSVVGSPFIREQQREREESLSSHLPSILNEAFPEYESDSPDSPQPGNSTLEVTPTTTGSQRLSALPPAVESLQARNLSGFSSSPGQDDDDCTADW